MNPNEYLLSEKYRPQTIDECILPEETKVLLEDFIVSGVIPNLLFCGSAGVGKTTVARALGRQLGYDVLFINASNEGRSIDTLRGLITDFASSMSLYSNRKLVILDEFDGTGAVVQDALRAFVEQYSSTCSFILTCNFKHKLIEAIHSRFSEVSFTIPSNQKSKVAVSFMKRIVQILDIEKIEYDREAVAELVKRYFPDFRRALTELQRFSSGGKFTLEQLKNLEVDINGIVAIIKDKKFSEMIAVVEKMPTIDMTTLISQLYDNADKYVSGNDKPVLIKILSDYLDKSTRTTNPKITCMALIAEIMANT